MLCGGILKTIEQIPTYSNPDYKFQISRYFYGEVWLGACKCELDFNCLAKATFII